MFQLFLKGLITLFEPWLRALHSYDKNQNTTIWDRYSVFVQYRLFVALKENIFRYRLQN